MTAADSRPLIMHVIYRFAMGGLENGLVNLINHMPHDRYRHAIVCLTNFTDFRDRIYSPTVAVLALDKQPGLDVSVYKKLWRIIREMKPAIVHTRNLPTLEMGMLAALAHVPSRVHGEHGRDIHDQYGASKKFWLFRQVVRLMVHHYVAVSRDLEEWLTKTVKISPKHVVQIYNGVDTTKFSPRVSGRDGIFPEGFVKAEQVVIGTVGRFQYVKGHQILLEAFVSLLRMHPYLRETVRLVLIGDGPLKERLECVINEAQIADVVWMPGERSDVSVILKAFDLFVLPSEAEGISNTILEAMATGLPVLATRVGGNAELVTEGVTGQLVLPHHPQAMAKVLAAYVQNPELMRRHGQEGRRRAEQEFSLQTMVTKYLRFYDELMGIESALATV